MVSTSVDTRVIVLQKLACWSSLDWMADLHNGSKFLRDGAVRIADTKDLTEVLTECAVVHEVVVLILIANVLLAFLLALEHSVEPVKNAIGRLQLIVPLLELTVRMRDAGKSKGA